MTTNTNTRPAFLNAAELNAAIRRVSCFRDSADLKAAMDRGYIPTLRIDGTDDAAYRRDVLAVRATLKEHGLPVYPPTLAEEREVEAPALDGDHAHDTLDDARTDAAQAMLRLAVTEQVHGQCESAASTVRTVVGMFDSAHIQRAWYRDGDGAHTWCNMAAYRWLAAALAAEGVTGLPTATRHPRS